MSSPGGQGSTEDGEPGNNWQEVPCDPEYLYILLISAMGKTYKK
jgi:hypothetical protein